VLENVKCVVLENTTEVEIFIKIYFMTIIFLST